MIGWVISHPTVVSSSRLISPYVETKVAGSSIALLLVLTRDKYVLLPKVAGGGLVVVDDEHPPPLVLAGSKYAVPSVPAVGGCTPTSVRAGWGDGLLLVEGVDVVVLPPERLVYGDVPLLVPVDRGGMSLSALVGVG